MARCLIVLNETVGGSELDDTVRPLIEDGCEFVLLAPAHGAGEEHGVAGGPVAAPPGEDTRSAPDIDADEARELADDILREAWSQLEELGAQVVDGHVGDPDPLEAIAGALEDGAFDRLVLVTPPAGASKLVAMDLPDRVERRFDLPVTAVTAPASQRPT